MSALRADHVRIPAGSQALDGDLTIPEHARGLVIFAHGSGSSRHSPRNRAVAAHLQQAGFATLLIDLLTPDEERADAVATAYRFDIPRLSDRLTRIVEWAVRWPDLSGLPIGLFGASTGAAAALDAAARLPGTV
ncbi:MAG: hydrolase, partial [Gemmatimonadaceae bacterium]|nr:hydrolase [Gemmatimonadaceae bacterium]